jgi:hypothetical protein
MAHMVKAYTPETIKRLFPAFAYLSTANPASLSQMERAFSYAVPTLQSGADVDPISTMLLGTALSTAGVTNSKSGTWIRSFVSNAMPGDDKHNAQLKRFGLLDANGKPTWFTDGKPDPAKALEIAGPIAAAMPPEERLPAELGLFGTRGAGAFSVLADSKVLERIKELRKEMGSEEFQNRYGSMLGDYMGGTTKGAARGSLAEFNVLLIELGTTVLPAATGALRGFTEALRIFGGGHRTPEDKNFKPNWMENLHEWMPWSGASSLPKQTIEPQKQSFLQGPGGARLPPISLSLNVDGRTLASAITDVLGNQTGFVTQAPAADGLGQFYSGDHNYGSK